MRQCLHVRHGILYKRIIELPKVVGHRKKVFHRIEKRLTCAKFNVHVTKLNGSKKREPREEEKKLYVDGAVRLIQWRTGFLSIRKTQA